ncbi:MAG: transposase [Acidimicrobiia bacterium]|nr:transposase [Acidimicrobiia bacterium]
MRSSDSTWPPQKTARLARLLPSLVARGLSGVQLVISDDHTGLRWMRSPAHVGQNCAVSDGRLLVSEVLEKLRDHSWPRNFYADAW